MGILPSPRATRNRTISMKPFGGDNKTGIQMKRLLITGASGNLTVVCRERLTHMAEIIRLSCRGDIGEPQPHEEIM